MKNSMTNVKLDNKCLLTNNSTNDKLKKSEWVTNLCTNISQDTKTSSNTTSNNHKPISSSIMILIIKSMAMTTVLSSTIPNITKNMTKTIIPQFNISNQILSRSINKDESSTLINNNQLFNKISKNLLDLKITRLINNAITMDNLIRKKNLK